MSPEIKQPQEIEMESGATYSYFEVKLSAPGAIDPEQLYKQIGDLGAEFRRGRFSCIEANYLVALSNHGLTMDVYSTLTTSVDEGIGSLVLVEEAVKDIKPAGKVIVCGRILLEKLDDEVRIGFISYDTRPEAGNLCMPGVVDPRLYVRDTLRPMLGDNIFVACNSQMITYQKALYV